VIAMSATASSQETLAAFLARIRPGDRCACCGAVMQSRWAQAVACPECGCEISEEDGSDAEEHPRRLSTAA